MQEDLFLNEYPVTQAWITGGAPGTDNISVIFPDDTVFIEDNESFGYEYEFTARPTPNWNIIVNISKTEVLRSRVFTEETNEVIDFIVNRVNGPAGDIAMWCPECNVIKDWVAPFIGQLVTNRALLGTPTGELRKWKGNLVTNYNFTDGILDGVGIGGAVRYDDSQVIGFPPIYVDPVTGNPITGATIPSNAAITVDLDRPYMDDDR